MSDDWDFDFEKPTTPPVSIVLPADDVKKGKRTRTPPGGQTGLRGPNKDRQGVSWDDPSVPLPEGFYRDKDGHFMGKVLFVVTFPWPPSTNEMYLTHKQTGKKYPNPVYTEWRERATTTMDMELYRVANSIELPITQEIGLNLRLHPITRAADYDNRIKTVQDFLVQRGIIKTDNMTQIIEGRQFYCGSDPINPRVIVTVHTPVCSIF